MPMPAYFPFRVRHHLEEGPCEWCGCNIRIGDDAVQLNGGIYCGDTCSENAERPCRTFQVAMQQQREVAR